MHSSFLLGPLPPPLKWAGGKRWLIPHLMPIWKRHAERRLVEPFCGALAVTLGLVPQRALLNDNNPQLIHFFSWVKRGLSIRQHRVEEETGAETDDSSLSTPPSPPVPSPSSLPEVRLWMENDRELYNAHRKRFNELMREGKAETAEAAALFYYLNRTCFNGLCRFNSSGEFNVPFGKYNNINYVRDFSAYQRVFADWEFRCIDFASVPLEPEDFVYADPPFDVEFTQYSKEGFRWEDQVRTAEWLARHPGPVVLSNQATNRIVDLYTKLGYQLHYLKAPRRISCNGDRTPAREVLALRNITG